MKHRSGKVYDLVIDDAFDQVRCITSPIVWNMVDQVERQVHELVWNQINYPIYLLIMDQLEDIHER